MDFLLMGGCAELRRFRQESDVQGLCFPWPLWADSHVEPGGKFCSCSFTRKLLGSWPHSVVGLEWPGGDVLRGREGGNDVVLGYGDCNRRELGWPPHLPLDQLGRWWCFPPSRINGYKILCFCDLRKKCTPCMLCVLVCASVYQGGQALSLFSLHRRKQDSRWWVTCPGHMGVHGSPVLPHMVPLSLSLCQHPFSPERFWAERCGVGPQFLLSPLQWWTQ